MSKITWGSGRKASLHPRLYAYAHFAGFVDDLSDKE